MFCIIIVIYKMITYKIPKVLPQKTEKFNSHKYFHGKSGFAALCFKVVFLYILKNLLGHFSKMDKENECPKFKNAQISLSNVFMWAGNSGNKQWEIGDGGRREVGVNIPTNVVYKHSYYFCTNNSFANVLMILLSSRICSSSTSPKMARIIL